MKIREKLYSIAYEQRWTIGFIEQPIKDVIEGKAYDVKYVKGMPHDRWFADPFILDYNSNTIIVLVEEFCYKIKRGRIAKLIIDRRTYKLLDYKIILDIETHLSFPFIRRKAGRVFLFPENSESGRFSMFEYDINTESIIQKETIVGLPFTDAIVTDFFGDELIFTTQIQNPNGNVLSVYSFKGSFVQEIVFPSKIARNAGDWINIGDKVYRPAQDCNSVYGGGVIIQEVLHKGGIFEFVDVLRIDSTHPMYTTGCHTLNSYNGLTVLDVHGWKRTRLAKLMSFIKKTKTR